MDNDKSPGNDGITKQFYFKFWEIIKESFFASIQQSFIVDELSTFQRQAVIKLTEKNKREIKDSLKTEDPSHFFMQI